MLIWFYLLWIVAIVHVFFAPILRGATKLLWGIVIVAGVWLLIGALTYQTKYAAHLLERKRSEDMKESLVQKKIAIDRLATAHQSSLPLRKIQAILAIQLGNIEEAKEVYAQMKVLHPTASEVVSVERYLE